MMMLSVAASIGLAHGAEAIAIAAHAGDHAIYPDCREEFFRRMDDVLSVTDYNPIRVSRPFANMSKADIIRGAYDSNFISPEFAPPLYLTWSCYEGGANPKNLHCGKCGTCVERKEAFVIAGVIDPTLYADERN
jgi:7-cyano-7-deazaguanine synthase